LHLWQGEVAEWLKAPLSKSGILAKTGIVGSNPTLSASTAWGESHGLRAMDELYAERCPSWLKEHDWKSCVLLIAAPRVRIPLSPPFSFPLPSVDDGHDPS
jgi:hypothetical protein